MLLYSALPSDSSIHSLAAAYSRTTHFWVHALLSKEQANYALWEQERKRALAWLEQSEDSIATAWQHWLMAELSLQHSVLSLHYGERWQSVMAFRKLYKQVQQAHKAGLPPEAIHKVSGMAQIMVGLVGLDYGWLTGLLNYEGSINSGLALLDSAAQGSFRPIEGKLSLAMAYAYLLGDFKEASSLMTELHLQLPQSSLITWLSAHIYIKNHESARALPLLQELQARAANPAYLSIPHLDYWLAEIYLQQGYYELARASYQAAHFKSSTQDLAKDRWYKTALCHWLQGDTTGAKAAAEWVLVTGNTQTAADRYADRQVLQNRWPEPRITALRFATDGGFADRAHTLLDQIRASAPTAPEAVLELYYRKARLAQLEGNEELAVDLFEQTWTYSSQQELDGLYFAAAAHLQSGHVARRNKENPRARMAYRLVLRYKNHAYRESLSRAAQLSLERLKK